MREQQLLIQLRPVLSPSRREDPPLKVSFGDMKWVQIPGGGAVGEVGPGDGSLGAATPVVYLAIGLRNAGNGIAVLQGWRFFPDAHRHRDHAPLAEFQPQTRDLHIPVGDIGFWQPVDHQVPVQPGDHPGQAAEARPGWLASASRHWSLDRPDAP